MNEGLLFRWPLKSKPFKVDVKIPHEGEGETIDPGLNDKVALITGGNNPFVIGAAIAQVFAFHGAKVFIHYRRQTRHIYGVYTQRFKRSHKRYGPLFQGRYTAIVIDRDRYLAAVVRSIHLN